MMRWAYVDSLEAVDGLDIMWRLALGDRQPGRCGNVEENKHPPLVDLYKGKTRTV